ncbi:MAG: acyltransferase family protein, partial [Sediminibacterium sp.]|nr:acyltransferase family protein [Sediminibacterium sp.]
MKQKERIYYLDWLRVVAFGILILFHSWQPFNNFGWLIKSDSKSFIADILTVFFHTWRLYLIFFISGVGTWITLNANISSFLNNRILRLIVPFVFASIIIVPCQYFYQTLQTFPNTSFINFISHYPQSFLHKKFKYDIFLWILEIGIHLWYLPSLFIMTLILLPLLKRINATGLSEVFLLRITKHPSLVFLCSLPIILPIIFLKPIFPEYTSLTDFLTYSCSFIYGFIFIKEYSRLVPIIQKIKTPLLISSILSSLLIISFLLNDDFVNAAFNPSYNIYHVIVCIPLGYSAFSWPLYFVSLFSQKFNFNMNILPELNRSILPIYILHQSLIVVGGYYIIKYFNNGFLEFIFIVLTTLIISVILYFFIKKFKVTRFLFG